MDSGPQLAIAPRSCPFLDGEDGTLTLAVHRDGVEVLEPSALGIVTSDSDFSTGLRFISRSDRVVTEEYAIPTGKRRERYAEMAEATFSFESAEARRVDVVIRVSDDGVATAIIPDETTVLREASSFRSQQRRWPFSLHIR